MNSSYSDILDTQRKLFIVLALSSIMGLGLVLFRVLYSGQYLFVFLAWNLFLAWIPVFVAMAAQRLDARGKLRGMVFAGCLGLWLLFFPNAPYILTDFVHFAERPGVPLWFDLVIILSFAINGMVLGFVSLKMIHDIVRERLGWVPGWMFAVVSLALGSFGIYLGRDLRWNSWDIVRQPTDLVADIAHRFLHPFAYPRAVGMTLLYSGFLIVTYLMLTVIWTQFGSTKKA